MREEVVYYDASHAKYGIISHPKNQKRDLPLVIFLNAGLINRQGPNGWYVKMSRALSSQGITSFRFDLPGIGDSVNTYRVQTREEMYALELKNVMRYMRSMNFRSFVLCGICSGADLAFDFALQGDDIVGVCMIDGTRIPGRKKGPRHVQYRYYRKYLTDIRRWLRLLTTSKLLQLPKYFSMVTTFVVSKVRRPLRDESHPAQTESIDYHKLAVEKWLRLLNSGIEVIQFAAEGSEAYDDLHSLDPAVSELNASSDHYRQHIVYDADHTFTSIASQEVLIVDVSAWLQDRVSKKTLHRGTVSTPDLLKA